MSNRSKKRAKRRARQEEKKVWLVTLRLLNDGSYPNDYLADAFKTAGNHRMARHWYESLLKKFTKE